MSHLRRSTPNQSSPLIKLAPSPRDISHSRPHRISASSSIQTSIVTSLYEEYAGKAKVDNDTPQLGEVQGTSNNDNHCSAAAAASPTRSKKMLVVDPKTNRKYHLNHDDHSLTDKELHVFHSNHTQHGRRSANNNINNSNTLEVVNPGDSNSISNHTLSTASALTDSEYYGNVGYQCHLNPACAGILASSAVVRGERCDGSIVVDEGEIYTIDEENYRRQDKQRKSKLVLQIDTLEGRDETEDGKEENARQKEEVRDGTPPGPLLDLPLRGCEPFKSSRPIAVSNFVSSIGELVSPRIASPLAAFKSFFPEKNDILSSSSPSFFGRIDEVKYKKLSLVIFPNEIEFDVSKESVLVDNGRNACSGDVDGDCKKNVGGEYKTLIGMTFRQCSHDFMAHVIHVVRGSRADKLGVCKGDVVNFAVALNNMREEESKSTLLVEKLIRRLESAGMRTSYRELFDIFLSKTTNTRPIGMVLRRWYNQSGGRGGIIKADASRPLSPLAMFQRIAPYQYERKNTPFYITDEFDWSTDFLRSLSVKCREYEFERKIPYRKNQILQGDSPLLYFLPYPESYAVRAVESPLHNLSGPMDQLSSVINLAGKYNCASALTLSNQCGHNLEDVQYQKKLDSILFLSYRLLSLLVEQAVGLVFVQRCINVSYGGISNSEKKVTLSGSGFLLVRKTEGEWSAPSFLEVSKSKSLSEDETNALSSFKSTQMIVINKKELVTRLILGHDVKLSVNTKQQRVNVLVRDVALIANKAGYFHLLDDYSVTMKVNDRQNEDVYSSATPLMSITARDVLLGTIPPPEQSVDFYGALQSLELPHSMHAHPVIPELIQPYCTSDWADNVSQKYRGNNSSKSIFASGTLGGMKTILKLVSQGDSMEDKCEIDAFTRRFKYYLMDGVPVHLIIQTNLVLKEEKILRLTIKDSAPLMESSLELSRKRRPGIMNVGMQGNIVAALDSISKLSRTPPSTLELQDEEKWLFFSFETDLSGGPIMMLTKSKKDSMLLLCGLKLLLEREKFFNTKKCK